MSQQAEVSPSSSKGADEERNESALVMMGAGAGIGDEVQDQVILAPEIMRIILGYLDLRGLKKVRLVCKSWLREAQIHVERRGGIVVLNAGSNSTRIQDFIDIRQRKLTALPQPFKSLHVSLFEEDVNPHLADLLANQLSSLIPPLSITRFFPTLLPLNLAFSLIVKCSSSLVYLQLFAITCEPGYLPPMDPDHIFPNLQDLDVEASAEEGVSLTGNHFPSIIAWIAKSSPNLKNYEAWSESWNESTLEMASELVIKVDIKNVKTVKLDHENLSDAAAEHFKSIPFTQLQNLQLSLHDSLHLMKAFLLATASKATATLRLLDLCGIDDIPDNFPICPNVREMMLFDLDDWNEHIPTHFPSLTTLSVRMLEVPLRGEEWEYDTPVCSLKELTVGNEIPRCPCDYSPEDGIIDPSTLSEEMSFGFSRSQTIKFFDNFPQLERLDISSTFVLHCCRLKANGDPMFSKLLEGVKHLNIRRHCKCWNGVSHASDYSSLAVLKEVESIYVELSEAVPSIPVHEMSGLKVLRFPWDESWRDLDKLLEIARGVEKVVVTNYCLVQRAQNALSKELLTKFLESAPNAGLKG